MSPAVHDSVFHSRAIRSLGTKLEDDPEVMVHQQLARLRFFQEVVGTDGKRVLDFGCGSGFNCNELTGASAVLGVDLSADAIAIARQSFPRCSFTVANGCDPHFDLGEWERILCCEVLEHVPDMKIFLDNLAHSLTPGGIAFLSTPNREIFSNGHEPSPINREHIKELNHDEFLALLTPRFSSVVLYGQRFSSPHLLTQWQEDVNAKIIELENGTRWHDPPPSIVATNRLVRSLYNIAPLRRLWKFVRWTLIKNMRDRRNAVSRPYSFKDFEFSKDCRDALWFCAVVTK